MSPSRSVSKPRIVVAMVLHGIIAAFVCVIVWLLVAEGSADLRAALFLLAPLVPPLVSVAFGVAAICGRVRMGTAKAACFCVSALFWFIAIWLFFEAAAMSAIENPTLSEGLGGAFCYLGGMGMSMFGACELISGFVWPGGGKYEKSVAELD